MHERRRNHELEAVFVFEPYLARPSFPATEKGNIQLELGEDRAPVDDYNIVRGDRGEAAPHVGVGCTDKNPRKVPVSFLDAYVDVMDVGLSNIGG